MASANDAVLAPLITAAEEETRLCEIENVLARARPVIHDVIGRHFRSGWKVCPEDVDDIASTVCLRLIAKLRAVAELEDEAIGSLDDYVATITYRAIYDYNRCRYPERTRLRKRLRYILTRDRRFAIWSLEGILACGLREWTDTRKLLLEPRLAAQGATRAMRDSDAPADAVEAIFRRIGGPIGFDALVAIAADVWGVRETRTAAVTELTAADEPLAARRVESMQFLTIAWEEIRDLRPMQRAALLLNLRDTDGANAASLLVGLGIAKFEDVAEATGLTNKQLAEIWGDLPLDDLTIGDTLGVTRQQVINLRKSARERLARRLTKRNALR